MTIGAVLGVIGVLLITAGLQDKSVVTIIRDAFSGASSPQATRSNAIISAAQGTDALSADQAAQIRQMANG